MKGRIFLVNLHFVTFQAKKKRLTWEELMVILMWMKAETWDSMWRFSMYLSICWGNKDFGSCKVCTALGVNPRVKASVSLNTVADRILSHSAMKCSDVKCWYASIWSCASFQTRVQRCNYWLTRLNRGCVVFHKLAFLSFYAKLHKVDLMVKWHNFNGKVSLHFYPSLVYYIPVYIQWRCCRFANV